MTKQEAIKKVSEDGFFLEKLSNEFKNDPEILLAALAHSYGDYTVFQFASAELRNNKEFVLSLVSKYGDALRDAPDTFRNDKEFMLHAVNIDIATLKHASPDILDDKKFMLSIAKIKGFEIDILSLNLRNDKDFMNELKNASAGNIKFTEYQIVIEAGDLYLVADGPLLRRYSPDDYDIYIIRNLRVQDKKGNVLTPVIEEIEISHDVHVMTFWTTSWKSGYSIIENKIYYEDMDKFYASDSNHKYLGFNSVKNTSNVKCNLDDLSQYLEPCPSFEFVNKVMFHNFTSQIFDFQKEYKITEFNKDILTWNGKTLTIKANT